MNCCQSAIQYIVLRSATPANIINQSETVKRVIKMGGFERLREVESFSRSVPKRIVVSNRTSTDLQGILFKSAQQRRDNAGQSGNCARKLPGPATHLSAARPRRNRPSCPALRPDDLDGELYRDEFPAGCRTQGDDPFDRRHTL